MGRLLPSCENASRARWLGILFVMVNLRVHIVFPSFSLQSLLIIAVFPTLLLCHPQKLRSCALARGDPRKLWFYTVRFCLYSFALYGCSLGRNTNFRLYPNQWAFPQPDAPAIAVHGVHFQRNGTAARAVGTRR